MTGDPPLTAYGAVRATEPALAESVRRALVAAEVDAGIAIGLIGCGWIAGMQLDAYRKMGLNVVALYDRHPERAEAHAALYYPDARVYTNRGDFLRHPGLQVVDVATHVDARSETVLSCIRAGKHVLSQKPFVEDLAIGEELAAAADDAGVLLAVNQNGRWAPHFGAMLSLVEAGLIGRVVSADFQMAWPHDLVVEDKPAFSSMADLILFDFGAHWFDLLGQLAPEGGLDVHAITAHRSGQAIEAPTQANVVVTGEDFVGSLVFRAAERFAEYGGYRVSGTRGVITQAGTSLGGQSVTLHTAEGVATIETSEDWFTHGLAGAMRALLSAISMGRTPPHAAGTALRGLQLCFAALQSARTGETVAAGSAVRRDAALR